jgi:hypothetical protein
MKTVNTIGSSTLIDGGIWPSRTLAPIRHPDPRPARRNSEPVKINDTIKMTRRALLVLSLLALLTNPVMGAVVDYLPVWLEGAAEPGGPWTTAPVRAQQVTPDGKLLVPAQRDHEYWRLRVSAPNDLGFSLGLPLINVPPTATKIARDFLTSHAAAGDTSVGDPVGDPFQAWRSSRLADTVIPVYEAAIDGGRTPAYLEFKVVANEPAPAPGSFRTTDGPLKTDQGFILVSLTEDDFPVADFSTEGETQVERLRRRAGTAQIKPMRFGSALIVAEVPGSAVLATEGTVLFRPSPELLQYSNYVGTSFADTLTGVSNRSPELSLREPLQPYASYEEMKADYGTNAFFQTPRARLKDEARVHWLIEKGTPPTVLRVQAGQTMTYLAGRDVRAARLDSPDEDVFVARLTPLGREGLRLDGVTQGSGVLYVQVDGREELFTLLVTSTNEVFTAAGVFTPGWRPFTPYEAGTDSDQAWYHQYQSLVFGGGGEGNKVGCGPCAWTMLMGWWDWKGVPVIFRPYNNAGSGLPNLKLGLPDAPKDDNNYSAEKMMHDFRDQWVDPLFCNIDNGQCGTPPDKMAEGIDYFASLRFLYNLVYLPLLQENLLGYGYQAKWAWAPKNGVNEFNKLARESIHDGHPAILGVGWLSHYVVAYKYFGARYELAPGYFPCQRSWFKANWGNGDWKYYKFTDNTFFATKCQFWQTATNYAAP